jgi:RNA polymerase sigma factor (TIGR02999 family)
MHPDASASLHRLLEHVDGSDRANLTRIFPLIYEDLRRIAHRYMDDQPSGHILQPTALVNEAFLKIRGGGSTGRVKGQGHAMALAAVAMRCILVDHARRRSSLKRGGDNQTFALADADGAADDTRDISILELDDLLKRLAELDPRRARIVELRFFAGMTNEEIASALGIARSTVVEDWTVARAWLRIQLSATEPRAGTKAGTNKPESSKAST